MISRVFFFASLELLVLLNRFFFVCCFLSSLASKTAYISRFAVSSPVEKQQKYDRTNIIKMWNRHTKNYTKWLCKIILPLLSFFCWVLSSRKYKFCIFFCSGHYLSIAVEMHCFSSFAKNHKMSRQFLFAIFNCSILVN